MSFIIWDTLRGSFFALPIQGVLSFLKLGDGALDLTENPAVFRERILDASSPGPLFACLRPRLPYISGCTPREDKKAGDQRQRAGGRGATPSLLR